MLRYFSIVIFMFTYPLFAASHSGQKSEFFVDLVFESYSDQANEILLLWEESFDDEAYIQDDFLLQANVFLQSFCQSYRSEKDCSRVVSALYTLVKEPSFHSRSSKTSLQKRYNDAFIQAVKSLFKKLVQEKIKIFTEKIENKTELYFYKVLENSEKTIDDLTNHIIVSKDISLEGVPENLLKLATKTFLDKVFQYDMNFIAFEELIQEEKLQQVYKGSESLLKKLTILNALLHKIPPQKVVFFDIVKQKTETLLSQFIFIYAQEKNLYSNLDPDILAEEIHDLWQKKFIAVNEKMAFLYLESWKLWWNRKNTSSSFDIWSYSLRKLDTLNLNFVLRFHDYSETEKTYCKHLAVAVTHHLVSCCEIE